MGRYDCPLQDGPHGVSVNRSQYQPPHTPPLKAETTMLIPELPFTVTDWSRVEATEHPGEHGKATWRTLSIGDLRIRMVEYTPGYVADHWCDKGHVLLVLDGELDTELKDGRRFKLTAGMSYQVSELDSASRRSFLALSSRSKYAPPREIADYSLRPRSYNTDSPLNPRFSSQYQLL
jgi:hypothetical protein